MNKVPRWDVRMWMTKLFISPVKIRIFCPKKSKFGPKMALLFILGQALPAYLVGGCGAGAVSRKTPIYFITIFILVCQSFCLLLQEKGAINIRDQENQLFVGRKEC